MAMNLQMDETYDLTKMLPFKEVGFWPKLAFRAMVPFYIPVLMMEGMF